MNDREPMSSPASRAMSRAASHARRPRRVAQPGALLAALVLGAAACARSGVETASPRATPVLTIVARDFAFDAPDSVVAGPTALRLVNRGPDLHHVWMARLDEGKSMSELFVALQAGGPLPRWVHEVGGPNTPAPGAEAMAVLDLAPGNYAILCLIPARDGVPHVMKGMSRTLTVLPRPAAAGSAGASLASTPSTGATGRDTTLSDPDVTMTMTDYDFVLSRPLTAGRHVLRVVNSAAQAHEVFIARLAPGKTPADILAWLEKQEGPPPGLPIGGTTGMATRERNDVVLDLAPGEYALMCFVPDAKDGRPHVAHGMVKQVTVR